MRAKECPLQKFLCGMILAVTLALTVFVSCAGARRDAGGAGSTRTFTSAVLRASVAGER